MAIFDHLAENVNFVVSYWNTAFDDVSLYHVEEDYFTYRDNAENRVKQLNRAWGAMPVLMTREEYLRCQYRANNRT